MRQSQEEFKNALAQVPPPASWASHSVIHQYHQQQLLHNASLSPNGDEMLPASTTHNSASGANSDPAAPTISTATTTTISTADPCQGVIFHECQNLTCWRTEQRPGEYALCAGCMQVRYCSAACQERDWRNHRDFCTLLRSDRRPHSRLIPPR